MMSSPSHQAPLSAPHVEVPLITIIGGNRAESHYGSHWDVTDSSIETRPLLIYEYKAEDHKTFRKMVEIRSHLRSVIRRIMDGYLGLNLDTDPLVFKQPFRELVYRSDEIFDYTAEDSDEQSALAKLKYFMSIEMRDSLQSFRLARTQQSHTFENLWTAYVPGDFVIKRYYNFVWCHQVIGSSFNERHGHWDVEHRSWDFDTESFGFVHSTTQISNFHGDQHGMQLPLVPVRSLPFAEWENIRTSCIARGHTWFKLQTDVHHYNYNATVSRPNDQDPDVHVRGRVVVDRHVYLEHFPMKRPDLNRIDRCPKDYLLKERGCLSVEQALLTSPRISAVALDEDRWYQVWIDELKEIEWATSLWDGLDISRTRKDNIRILCDEHDPSIYEPLAKGRGLIFFLKGPPGTGKTLTVESIAEVLHRPLYKASPSQWKNSAVVDKATDPERRFRTIFKLAHKWNAILLVDEADSIITKDETKPPALQAFLRQVEQYRGIAFLTSNMDQNIDDAVRSRLTSTLQYDRPSAAQAQQAWEKHLTNRAVTASKASDGATHLTEMWNLDYRQINAALLLADIFAKARKTSITTELIDEALAFRGEKPRTSVADVGNSGSKLDIVASNKMEDVPNPNANGVLVGGEHE